MMLQEESITKIIVDTFNEAGFDPAKDQLMNYQFIEGVSPPQWRAIDIPGTRGSGVLIDWDLLLTADKDVKEISFEPGIQSFHKFNG